MKILVVTPYYTPDLGPSAPLLTLLCSQLIMRGHQVTVVTSVPHFPSGKVQQNFKGKWIKRTVESGVEVIRVAVPSIDRSNLIKRLLQFISFQISAALAIINQKHDVALFTNPAIECWLPFFFQKLFYNKPNIYSVYDIYPDVGIKLGIFRNKFVISIVAWLERYCLNKSEIIHIISDSFRPGLKALGVPDSKMDLVQLWVDTDFIRPMAKNNPFTEEHGLTNQVVIMYAGNIGLSQGLENVLEAAELLKDHKNLRFVFIGNGNGLAGLKNQVKDRKMENVVFIPFQPHVRLPEILSSANIMLVILNRGIGSDSLPSKIFTSLAIGRPILASIDPDSEAWRLIKQYEAGICIPPEDPKKIAESILILANDESLSRRLGNNGRKTAEKFHSARTAAEKFEELFVKANKIYASKI